MLILLSPSKTQAFTPGFSWPSDQPTTAPRMLESARAVVTALRALPNEERHRRLKLSPKLTAPVDQALAAWTGRSAPMATTEGNGGTSATGAHPAADTAAAPTRPAAFAYTGETYRGLSVHELDRSALEQLQGTVRILSALYGVLRPLDCIESYRLDFGTRLAVGDSPSLYDFWRPQITEQLARDVRETGAPAVINLASSEFARAVDASALGAPLITPEFRQRDGYKLKNVTVFTKQARGAMARWIVVAGAKNPEALLSFSEAGYRYDREASSQTVPLFVRDRP